MNSPPSTGPPDPETDRAFERHLREMNEVLMISAVRQHELADEIEIVNAAVRASNARFEALFDASPVGMYLVDSELRIRLMSRKARLTFGDIAGVLIGSDFVKLVHILWPPAIADDIIVHFRHTLETGDAYIAPEFSEERSDRKVREYYEWQVHRIALPDGQYGVVCYFTDISSRVLAEQKMHVSEMRFRRLFESAKDGILILDFNTGKIVDSNPYVSELLGYSHDDFSGKELWEIGLFSDKSACKVALRKLQAKGYVRIEHLPLKSGHGARVEVEVVANVYREDQHSLIQCNVRDITERSLLEKQLQEQAAELEDLHRRKDEFLAMLSHELRNPLAPIANAVQLLSLQAGSESVLQQRARAIIERQMGRLQRLIDDLLEVSRITTGKIHLHREHVPVSGIIDLAAESVRPLMERSQHQLTVSVPPDPIWLYADVARLEQVIVNLLSNAAKYTAEGGHIELLVSVEDERGLPAESDAELSATPSVATHHAPPGNRFAVIRVRDSGVGIMPGLLPRIFDLFTQAEQTLDRSQGGLGIGLALVQRLTKLHGGTVEAHSILGQGSEFIVRLPVSAAGAPPMPLAVTAEIGLPAERPLRVLVVDDNVDTAESLAMLLLEARHDVRLAHDGPSALESALEFRPHVMLLDIGLPNMDGYEVAQRIRQHPALQNMALVALTGYGLDADCQRSRRAGFDHHLVKPANFGEVRAILATISEQAT